jgi:hypothetical protein
MKSPWIAAGILYAGLVNAIMALTYPVKLTEPERALIERTACTSPHAVGAEDIKPWTHQRGGRADGAEVRCRPHTKTDGKDLRYFAQCSREKSAWTCGDGGLEIAVPVEDREVIVRFTDLPPAIAESMIVKLAKGGWLREQPTHPLPEVCEISKDSVPEWLRVDCDGWGITMSTWCPQDECPRVIGASREIL